MRNRCVSSSQLDPGVTKPETLSLGANHVPSEIITAAGGPTSVSKENGQVVSAMTVSRFKIVAARRAPLRSRPVARRLQGALCRLSVRSARPRLPWPGRDHGQLRPEGRRGLVGSPLRLERHDGQGRERGDRRAPRGDAKWVRSFTTASARVEATGSPPRPCRRWGSLHPCVVVPTGPTPGRSHRNGTLAGRQRERAVSRPEARLAQGLAR